MIENDTLEKLEEIRLEAGESKSEFANRFDVSRNTYHNWISGEQEPNDLNAHKIKTFVNQNYGLMVAEKVEEKFNKSDDIMVERFFPVGAYKSTWEKVDRLDTKLVKSEIRETLEKLAEREEVEA
jgi:DNA-binding XRE family transcriptional regulator